MASSEKDHKILLGVAASGAICVAIALLVWGIWIQNRPPEPLTRTTFDFIVTWRCLECGHTLADNAAPGPRTCPRCNRNELYASIRWTCALHGAQPVAFQYDPSGDPTEVKVGAGPWVSYTDAEGAYNIKCPVCGRAMMPAEAPRPR